jgi:hypothetical protein
MNGRDDFPRAGYPHGDPHEMPADLAAVQADDTLLDLLGSGCLPGDDSDELTRVLAAWRREVHATPVRELVDTNTALGVIRAAARRPVGRRNPVFGSMAAAAAVLVIAFAGVGLVAKQAQPGDQLWGVTQVLYSDYARSVETAATVRTELNDARTALQENKPERAKASLQRVRQQLPVIGDTEGRAGLTTEHRALEQILQGSPEGSSEKMPSWPAFPPSSFPSQKPQSTMPPMTSQPTPAEATSTPSPSPTTESPTSTSSPLPSKGPHGPNGGHSGVGNPRPGTPPEGSPIPGASGEGPGNGSTGVSGPNGNYSGGAGTYPGNAGFPGPDSPSDGPPPAMPSFCDGGPEPQPPQCSR